MISEMPLFKLCCCLLIGILFFVKSRLHAGSQPVIQITDEFEDSINIQGSVFFWVDSTKEMNISGVLSQKLKKLDSVKLNPRYNYWATFSIRNNKTQIDSLLLYCGEFDHIYLYDLAFLDKAPVKAGLLTSFIKRPYRNNERYVPILLPPNQEKQYLVLLQNELRDFENDINFSLFTESVERQKANQWMAERSGYDVFFGFYLGVLVLFLIFSIFQYAYYQDKAYLFYVLYLAGVFFYFLRILESGTQFNLLFSHVMELYYYFEAPFPLLSVVAYIYFLIHFLDLPRNNPKLLHLFQYSALGVFVYIFIDLLIKLIWGLETSLTAYFFARVFGIGVGVYAVIEVLKIRNWLTFFIIIGSFFLLIGGAISILKYATAGGGFDFSIFNDMVLNAKTNFWSIPISYMQIGIILEVLLFSIGLSYRNKIVITEKEEHERKWVESELKALKAQLKPHFIFNSLNSVIDLIQREENEKAEDYLVQFSYLLRNVLDKSENLEITLAEEFEICKQYLTIEQLRFKDSFTYKIEVEDTIPLEDIKIPPLLLQPFLENAIWHGLLHKEKGVREVSIIVSKQNGHILCSVQDNGIGRDAAKKISAKNPLKKQSFGMKIIKDRLHLLRSLNDKNLTINVIDNRNKAGQPSGTRIDIIIPQS